MCRYSSLNLTTNQLSLGLSGELLDSCKESLWVCADDLGDLLAVLEDDECRHCSDTEVLSNFWDFVDVDLDEVDTGELF